MNIQLRRVAAVLCAAGIVASPSIAFSASNDVMTQEEANKIRSEMKALKSEMNSLKTTMRKSNRVSHHAKRTHHPVSEVVPATNYGNEAPSNPAELPFDLHVPGRSFVSIGPYTGLPYSYSGSNLIINSPSVNTDVQLLNTRRQITRRLNETVGNLSSDAHPHLLLSGIVEGQADIEKMGGNHSSDINLTNVSLDAILFGPSEWLLGFVELSYNSGNGPNGTLRVANSNMYLNKAFITIGNFACSPVYGTLGQYYVPFGTYSSVMVSDPFTKLLARTKARALTIGFQQQDVDNAFYGAVFGFRGDAQPHNNQVNNGGVNVGYKFNAGSFSGNIGGGVIANLADSVGMQLGMGSVGGFANSVATEQLAHRVPAYDLRGTLSIGEHIDIIGEYITAGKRFAMQDMSFNSHGAKPWALNLEASYSFKILDDKPSNIGVGIGRTGQALGLELPKSRYAAVFNTSLLQHTLQSVEFRRDRLYGNDNASIAGMAVPQGKKVYDNVLTVQFDYYF